MKHNQTELNKIKAIYKFKIISLSIIIGLITIFLIIKIFSTSNIPLIIVGFTVLLLISLGSYFLIAFAYDEYIKPMINSKEYVVLGYKEFKRNFSIDPDSYYWADYSNRIRFDNDKYSCTIIFKSLISMLRAYISIKRYKKYKSNAKCNISEDTMRKAYMSHVEKAYKDFLKESKNEFK